MLDAVFNHIGDTSPQWQDVLENGENQNLLIGFTSKNFQFRMIRLKTLNTPKHYV